MLSNLPRASLTWWLNTARLPFVNLNNQINKSTHVFPYILSVPCVYGLLNNFILADMILADKGFLIQDLLRRGVSMNIPPFLNCGKFWREWSKSSRVNSKVNIHMEHGKAILNSFKVLNFIPSFLHCQARKRCQLCAALVNLQLPLIKDGCNDFTN